MTSHPMDLRFSKIVVTLLSSGRCLFKIPSLEIPFGSKVLIYGPSGQGKTTLLHLMAGLFLPTDGVVYLGDQKLSSCTDDERSRLRRYSYGIVFQTLNLLDHMTAIENVLLGLSPDFSQKEQQVRAKAALSQVDMRKFSEQRSSNLSLGEQQRVAIARVLATGPSIILADEPTSSLDDKNAQMIMEALIKAAEGKTLVVVSHDLRIRAAFDRQINFTDFVPR